MVPTITKTAFYELISLPIKYTAMPIIDRQFPPSNIRQIQDYSTSELQAHPKDVLIATGVGCIAAPIIEEAFFRGALPLIITYATGCPEELSLVISGVAFSALHYSNKKAISDVLFQCADCYFLFNPLKIAYGLPSTITAHVIHNSIQFVPILKRTFWDKA